MNWWKNLLEGRRLRPQTVALLEPRNERSLEMSDSLRGWLAAAFSVGEGTKDREARRSVGIGYQQHDATPGQSSG